MLHYMLIPQRASIPNLQIQLEEYSLGTFPRRLWTRWLDTRTRNVCEDLPKFRSFGWADCFGSADGVSSSSRDTTSGSLLWTLDDSRLRIDKPSEANHRLGTA